MRIVLSTFGTFGDVNPLIALALELKRRGHQPVLAVPEMFRPKIEPLGIRFSPVRPDQDQSNKQLVAMIYDKKTGTEYGLRKFLFPALRQSYDDLLAAVEADGGADLLVTGELAYAGPIIAEKTGIPWATYVLAPFSFFSAYDPPVLPPYPGLARAQAVTPGLGHVVNRFARRVTRGWPKPVYELRRELGLDRGKDPIFDAKHSEALVLALFSRVLGDRQPDWPRSTVISGFVFYDGDAGHSGLSPELERFLAAGPPPMVFTLGSAAVLDAGDFYEQSAQAAKLGDVRAVLLVGNDPANVPKLPLPENICIAKYAPYSQLFPRASVIVHQGGVGTTAQALRAGKPMLVMPYSHDQPDNARRMKRLGVAKVVQRKNYTAEKASRFILELLRNTTYSVRATEVQRRMAAENGLETACNALENLLNR
ncbi:glycosyltransferase [Acidobacterium sp. S8]|uniref:glycosyltransferase n=1 Tax=Acidobacterium sp. S8 TaxID=1641854 RepID=UPI00131E978A|nr:glycosyltransferase [Acidobacterium sp. S8]